METLIIAGLIAISIVSAVLAERQRRRAEALQTQLDLAHARTTAQRQLARTEGLFEGWRRGWSESYTAACKALREGCDPAEAVLAIKKAALPDTDYEGANTAPINEHYYIHT